MKCHTRHEAAYSLNIGYKTAYSNLSLRSNSSNDSLSNRGWQTPYSRERAGHQLYSCRRIEERELRQQHRAYKIWRPQRTRINQPLFSPRRCPNHVMPQPHRQQLASNDSLMNHNDVDSVDSENCEYESMDNPVPVNLAWSQGETRDYLKAEVAAVPGVILPLAERHLVSGEETSHSVPVNLAWSQGKPKDFSKAMVAVVPDEVIMLPAETPHQSLVNSPSSRTFQVQLTQSEKRPSREAKDNDKSDTVILTESKHQNSCTVHSSRTLLSELLCSHLIYDLQDMAMHSVDNATATHAQLNSVSGENADEPKSATKKTGLDRQFKNNVDSKKQSVQRRHIKKNLSADASVSTVQHQQTGVGKKPIHGQVPVPEEQNKKPKVMAKNSVHANLLKKSPYNSSKLPKHSTGKMAPKSNGPMVPSTGKENLGMSKTEATTDSQHKVGIQKISPKASSRSKISHSMKQSKQHTKLTPMAYGSETPKSDQINVETSQEAKRASKVQKTKHSSKAYAFKLNSHQENVQTIHSEPLNTRCSPKANGSKSKSPHQQNLNEMHFNKATSFSALLESNEKTPHPSPLKAALGHRNAKPNKSPKVVQSLIGEAKTNEKTASRGQTNVASTAMSKKSSVDKKDVSKLPSDAEHLGMPNKFIEVANYAPGANKLDTQNDISDESTAIDSFMNQPVVVTTEPAVQHPKQAFVTKFINRVQDNTDGCVSPDIESFSDASDNSIKATQTQSVGQAAATKKKSIIEEAKHLKQKLAKAPRIDIVNTKRHSSPCYSKALKPSLTLATFKHEINLKSKLRQCERAMEKSALTKSLAAVETRPVLDRSIDSTRSTSCKLVVEWRSSKRPQSATAKKNNGTDVVLRDTEKLSSDASPNTAFESSAGSRDSNRQITMYDSLGDVTSRSSILSDFMRPFRESQKARERRLACREFGIQIDEAGSHELFICLISPEIVKMFGYHANAISKIARLTRCKIRLKRAILNRQTAGSQTWARFAQIDIDGQMPRSVKICDRMLCEKFPFYKERRVVTQDTRNSVSTSSPERKSSDNSLLAFSRQRYSRKSALVRWFRHKRSSRKVNSVIVCRNSDAHQPQDAEIQVISAESVAARTAETGENPSDL